MRFVVHWHGLATFPILVHRVKFMSSSPHVEIFKPEIKSITCQSQAPVCPLVPGLMGHQEIQSRLLGRIWVTSCLDMSS